MTAREKFMARLEEEGLLEEWLAVRDHVAKFKEDGGIVLFTHYDWDSKDGYWEFHYPPFNEMRDHESFVRECKSFYDNDDEFVGKLAKWLEGFSDECPLSPVDAYFPGQRLETKRVEFEDDAIMDTCNNHDPELVNKINKAWAERAEDFCPILIALYERDLDEILEADSFKWTEGKSRDEVYVELQTRWEDHAYNYLMHIADGWDLDTILKFLRLA